MVQTNSRVEWSQFYCEMSQFHCLVMVLFSAMFSCFQLDSFELPEMVSIVSPNMKLLSLLSTSRSELTARVMMNMLAIRHFFLMLETEESISEIDSHHILQEASEL